MTIDFDFTLKGTLSITPKTDGTGYDFSLSLNTGEVVESDTVVIEPEPDPTEPEPDPTEPSMTASIALDLGTAFQTMNGWEVTAQAGQSECTDFATYKDQLFNKVEGWFDRLRVEVPSGVQSGIDWYTTGTRDEWKAKRYDPEKGAPYQWAIVDEQLDSVVLPLVQKSLSEVPRINLCFVDFNPHTGYNHRHDPDAYADLMYAAMNRVKAKGLLVDSIEIILEADNAGWTAAEVEACMVALRMRMNSAGEPHVDMLAPSCLDAQRALSMWNAMATKPDVLTYHRYASDTPDVLSQIGALGVRTAMLEKIGADIDTLWEDLTIANVESWQQFALAFCTTEDKGGCLFYGQPPLQMGERTKLLQVFFDSIRRGDVRHAVRHNHPEIVRSAGFLAPSGEALFILEVSGPVSIKYPSSSCMFYSPGAEEPRTIFSGSDDLLHIPSAGYVSLVGTSAFPLEGEAEPDPTEPDPTEPDPTEPDPTPTEPSLRHLGFNMDFIYGGAFGFNDKMRMGQDWVSLNPSSGSWWDDGVPLALGPSGYPTSFQPGQQAGTLVPTYGLNAEFVITWKGEGSIQVSQIDHIVSQSQGAMIVRSHPSQEHMKLVIESLPISDIHVYRMGVERALPWDPIFTGPLMDVECLRFMQWGLANGDDVLVGNLEKAWADRKDPSALFQMPKVAWEHMIDLCNFTGSDLWICIPHMATDDYIQTLGALVAANLDPAFKVYVEWSNEVWNRIFKQCQYAQSQGMAAGFSSTSHEAGWIYQGVRSEEVWAAFERGFGAGGRTPQVVRVLGGQVGHEYAHDLLFSRISAGAVDAFAVAPYFGGNLTNPTNLATLKASSVDEIIASLGGQSLPVTLSEIDASKRTADKYGCELIAYEGGQHLVLDGDNHNDTELVQKLFDVNRSPGMGALYRSLLDYWAGIGGGLFCHYTYAGKWSKYGSWGAMNGNRDTDSEKYKALVEWQNG